MIEIVFVDPLYFVTNPSTHADIVRDHQPSQFLPVDQDDALRTPRHIVSGGAREARRGDEYALRRAAASIAPAKLRKSLSPTVFPRHTSSLGHKPRPTRVHPPGSYRRFRHHPIVRLPGPSQGCRRRSPWRSTGRLPPFRGTMAALHRPDSELRPRSHRAVAERRDPELPPACRTSHRVEQVWHRHAPMGCSCRSAKRHRPDSCEDDSCRCGAARRPAVFRLPSSVARCRVEPFSTDRPGQDRAGPNSPGS